MTRITSLQTPEQINQQYESILRRIDLVDECWIWTGNVNSVTGLPKIYKFGSRRDGKPQDIAVARWLLEHKHFIPLGMRMSSRLVTVKTCTTDLCVNPDHHTTVTKSEHLTGRKYNTRKKRNYGLRTGNA